MKKFISVICAALLMGSVFTGGVSAADSTIKYEIKSVTKAPVADGKISVSEYGGNKPIVLDGSGKNTESGWNKDTNWTGHTYKLYYTWDKTNLYVGVTVEGEKTGEHLTKKLDDKYCIWGNGDMFQLGFNPGLIIKDVQPLYYCVSFVEDGQPEIHGDAYQSETPGYGSSTRYVTDEIKGFTSKYSETGINYTAELTIPWDKIFVKGVCRENQGYKLFDMTGEKAKLGDGYELPVFFLYRDNSTDTIIRTAGKDYDYTWNAQDQCPLRLVLKDAKSNVNNSAQTADGTALMICAMTISAIGAAVVIKKKH